MPKLEQINSARILNSHSLGFTKKELLNTELLLLEAFGWNLCLPTPAHFLDYYLSASISQKDNHCHIWPATCSHKTKECLREFAHYFLEVTLQGENRNLLGPRAVGIRCSNSCVPPEGASELLYFCLLSEGQMKDLYPLVRSLSEQNSQV